MSWPIGYGEPNVEYSCALDGTILANGVRVTSAGGWLDVDLPLCDDGDGDGGVDALAPGSVQIGLERDAHGHAFLYARKVMADGEEFEDVHALFAAGRHEWVRALPVVVHEEIDRRLYRGCTSSLAARQSVRPPAVTRGELWDVVAVPHGCDAPKRARSQG